MMMLYFDSVKWVSELDDSYPSFIDYMVLGSKVSLDKTAIEQLEDIASMVKHSNCDSISLDTYSD